MLIQTLGLNIVDTVVTLNVKLVHQDQQLLLTKEAPIILFLLIITDFLNSIIC